MQKKRFAVSIATGALALAALSTVGAGAANAATDHGVKTAQSRTGRMCFHDLASMTPQGSLHCFTVPVH
jgi:hypothetical protein